MTPIRLGYGQRYNDGSGWEWQVSLDTDRDGSTVVRVIGGGSDFCLDPTEVDLRAIARAFTEIADALGYELMDEDIEAAKEIVADLALNEAAG